MKILLTTTSFQDTPGKHHDFLNSQNWEIDYLRGPLDESVLLPIIHKYDGVICGDDEYTQKVIKAGSDGKLKALSKYGVGLDKIDLDAAKQYGVSVSNVPGVNQVSVAEHVLALLFSFEKNIHLQFNSTKNGSWNRMIGNEIEGRTIGIIGLGFIGKELSKKSVALGMNVIGYDLVRDDNFLSLNPKVEFTSSIELIYEKSDIISLHIPHNKSTEKIINFDVINNKLNKKPILINTARGMLIDVDAVIHGLKNYKIRAYLTDVLANEPILDDEKLKGLDNVIITPHIGSRTFQSVEKQALVSIKNLLKLIDNEKSI
jgi:D-3-phosphoglycerate dehydrogenase